MSAPDDRLPDEAIDGLLDGSPSEEAVGTPLAAYLTELRNDAQATTPAPSSELTAVLAEGLDPAGLKAAAPSSDEGAQGGIVTWRRRARMLGRVLVTKFAALGLLGKAAAAGAAVTVAASGAGATGVLPEPAQHEFNEIVGREAPVEHAEESATTDDVDGAQAETPADTSTTPPLEADVSDDATGEDGSEPGVDGRDVAEDASDGASRAPEDTPADERPTQPPADADRGGEAVDGTASDATSGEARPTAARAAKQDRKHDVRETGDREVGEQPSDHPSERRTTDDGPRG